jgi:DNA-binding SARP family transcriptional activator/ABC-type branched-subunit amino acid transport system substrate-binding protein/DNA-binding beta-propeller fold protein YncE
MDFRVLGPLEVTDGARAVPLGEGRQRSVLVLLLLHRNEAVPSERLVEALWGECPPPTAAKVLQNHVGQLRRALGPRDAGRLQTRGRGYLLRVEPGELDLDRFEQLARDGADALGRDEAADAAARLREALTLWRGPALADVAYEPFAQPEIAALEEERLTALEQRIDVDLALGRHAGVIAELERLIAEHPLRERPRGQLMLALYRSGRQAEALDAYADARRRLVEELGIEPGPELQDLQRRILAHDPELGPDPRPRPLVSGRRPLALLLAGAVLVLAAVVGGIFELTRGSAPITSLSPGSVGAIDPDSGRIVEQVSLPGDPTRFAAGGRSVWVTGDDSHTVSKIDPGKRTVTRLLATGGFPSALAAGGGVVWVLDGRSGLLRKVDPAYGVGKTRRVAERNPAYDVSRAGTDPGSVAAGLGSVWLTDGSQRLIRVDPATAEIVRRIDLRARLDGVAAGAGAVWAISGPSATVIRVDRSGRETARIPIVSQPGFRSPYPLEIAVGEGFVWVLNGNTATVTKIDPESRGVSATIPIGLERGAQRLAVGDGAAWVANADGSLARIDPTTNVPRFLPVAHGLKDVAVAAGAVWVTAGSGLSASAATRAHVGGGPVRPLPRASCAPIYYQGGGQPQYLIAADLALQGGSQLDQAIRYVLRQHGFRAGRYAIAYQACDNWTPAGVSAEKDAANAHAYANDRSVIGVIGPWASLQAKDEIAIANRAPAGPLAMVNAWNTYVGLTRPGPGTAPDEPARYYPTGTRNYVRIQPADDVQGAADALIARRLGARRAFLFIRAFPYGIGIAAAFKSAAAKLGIEIAGSFTEDRPARSYKSLAARIAHRRADAVFIATDGPAPGSNTGTLIKDLRARLGPGVPLLAPDSFADFAGLVKVAGAAAEGMTVSVPGLPNERLPAPGKTFVADFGATVGESPDPDSVRAAQATEVLLDAIARSDGTRASVTRVLFKTKITNGLIGSFSINHDGDTDAGAVTIYRITHGTPRILTVTKPPPGLLH